MTVVLFFSIIVVCFCCPFVLHTVQWVRTFTKNFGGSNASVIFLWPTYHHPVKQWRRAARPARHMGPSTCPALSCLSFSGSPEPLQWDVNEGIRIVSMLLNQRLVRFCRQDAPKTIQEMQTYA